MPEARFDWRNAVLMLGIGWFAASPVGAQEETPGMVLLPVGTPGKAAPLFYSAEAESRVRLEENRAETVMDVKIDVHQGRPERITLGLSGAGEVGEVSGAELSSWAVRETSDGERFLDLFPKLPPESSPDWRSLPYLGASELKRDLGLPPYRMPRPVPDAFEFRITATHASANREPFAVPLPNRGGAIGFGSEVSLEVAEGSRFEVTSFSGLSREEGGRARYFGTGEGRLELRVLPEGAERRAIELVEPKLTGRLSEDEASVSFVLRGSVRVREAGASLPLLEGVALSGPVEGANWRVRLAGHGDAWRHELVGTEAGDGAAPLVLRFDVPVSREEDWRAFDFRLPAGVIVPVRLEGVGDRLRFSDDAALVPERRDGAWVAYLDTAGRCGARWKPTGMEGDGALFYSSTETAEVRVGAGLLRQTSEIGFRVLQGRLEEARVRIDGAGEVLNVEGGPVLGWHVRESDGARLLEIELSRPIEGSEELRIEAQTALGGFPVRAEPMRFTPEGTIRHSGFVRVANEGAVTLEVVETAGMMQLAPGRFPGGGDGDPRQAFVYRFPSAEYEYAVTAEQVLPEVGVSEVTIHEMGETDRRIVSDLELDIREAPLREWTVGVPDDFAVGGVSGASVADYVLASESEDGVRALKILFEGAVSGRQLVGLTLERNEPAAAGEWTLPRLRHDRAASTRGYVGVASAAGYRVVPEGTDGLVETPVDYFPKQMPRLQQAFRIREEAWSAVMRVEALPRSVQADVFHLYSLKEGVAYGSVLLNYFVVGAPANEWRVRVPEAIGNVAVTGQGVGRDWRREGEELIVPLARPALGAATLLVTFEQPMSARGGALRPGEVRPLNVQSERGYVQVTSPLQVDAEVVRAEGSTLRIDAQELPAEYRLLTSAPTLAAWQYTAADVDLEMDIRWYESGEAIGEVVDFASLDSRVSRDGQVVTEARFFARSKGAASLAIGLPAGADLWEARVAGERVNARRDEGRTLVPLPRDADPNAAVEVLLRYGQTLGERYLELEAPEVGAATAVANWTVRGDDGRQLVPEEAEGARLKHPVLTETGFEWIASHGRRSAPLMLMVAALGLVFARFRRSGWVGAVLMIGAAVTAFMLANHAFEVRRVNQGALEYTASAVLEQSDVRVVVGNIDRHRAMISEPGVAAALGGVVLLCWTLLRARGRRVSALAAAGVALVGFGILAQHGGAIVFFVLFGIALLVVGAGPWIARLAKAGRRDAAAAALAGLCCLGFAERAGALEPAESVTQVWQLEEQRLEGEIMIRVRAEEAGQRFRLLAAPAVLTGFESAGLDVIREDDAYVLVAERPGVAEGLAGFRMKVGEPREGWSVPTGPAAVRTIYASHDRPGWRFGSADAASIREGVERDGADATEIRLLPGTAGEVFVRPRQRDATLESVRFFTETADLYLPGPGVVDGRHRVSVRPAQGVVRELSLEVPEGFMVGEVGDGPVGRWRFNPETRELRVAIEPAQSEDFAFRVSTQRATEALPAEVSLSPLRVAGGDGAIGMLGLAFSGEAQPEGVTAAGMGEVNLDDFPDSLLPRGGDGDRDSVLQKAYRYGADEASVSLRVTPVDPEIRAEVAQTISLGVDRLVVAADLDVRITRAGVFRLLVEIPEDLEVESVTGPALSHWTETEVAGERVLSLNLNGRTLGARQFALSLAGPSPGGAESWRVPRLRVREAARQRGTLTVVPGRGLQVRAVERTHVSPLDPRGTGAPRPGALAFRLLQADWALSLAVRELDPWVTARVLHQVTLREGQMGTRVRLLYRIENAARRTLRVRLPGLDERAAATVRASGPAVGDFVPVEGEEGVWEIRFQRGVAGETPVDVEFRSRSGDDGVVLAPVEPLDVRQLSYFLAIRTGGRLEARAEDPPRGWRKIDWSGVPAVLRDVRGGETPDLAFRVAEAEGPLELSLARHGLAEAEALRGVGGRLTTLMSAAGASMTSVRLDIQASGKSSLRLRLPGGARPFNLLVNGEGVPLVREGDEWLFYVAPSPREGEPAEVAFTYARGGGESGRLVAPQLDVPLEDLIWDVFVPEGLVLVESEGDFHWQRTDDAEELGLDAYRGFVDERRRKGRAAAVAELDQGYEWLQQGRQDKAGKVLGKAARSGFLDAASNEDARVQFRNLRMQQAVLGLNTRRQRIYMDNRFKREDEPNQQMERAAEENPILRGAYNFDPSRFDELMTGNSAEETSSLREIANRIVEQQMEVVGAPDSLDVELLGQGTRFRFTRSLQVKGDRPMTLDLELRSERSGGWLYGGLIGVLSAVVLVAGARRRGTEPSLRDADSARAVTGR